MFFKSSWDERFDPKLKMFWHNNFSTSLFSTKLSKNREWSLFFLHFLLYGTNIKMAFETILNLLCFVRHTLFPSNFSICPQHKSIKEQKKTLALTGKIFPLEILQVCHSRSLSSEPSPLSSCTPRGQIITKNSQLFYCAKRAKTFAIICAKF